MTLLMRWRQGLVALGLIAALLATERRTEARGDMLQIALPVAALGCAVVTGGAGELFGRFVATQVVVHGLKNGLGEAPINIRPSGGHRGIPSGHTASAAFGASALVHGCLDAPALRIAVVLAAGYVGGSRIAVDAHDTLQVVVGAAVGIMGERLARRGNTRRRLARILWRIRRSREHNGSARLAGGSATARPHSCADDPRRGSREVT